MKKQRNEDTVANIRSYLEARSVIIRIASMLLLGGLSAFGASNYVVATFDGSPSSVTNYVGNYAIGYGQASRGTNLTFAYPSNQVASKTNLSITVSNLGPGLWWFSAYAIATNGTKSDFSNEAGWTNKSFGPQNLRISGPVDALALQSSGDLQTWKTLAVITSTNTPLVVAAQPRAMFRVQNTNIPPIPK